MIYVGIGSRSTPHQVQTEMINIARDLAVRGWLLRSGGADGADAAFEQGCGDGRKEIWLPWRGFNGNKSQHIFNLLDRATMDRAYALAISVHPAWNNCSHNARRLHARNVLQVLGGDLKTPADRVICWTPEGRWIGGTATALRLAQQYNIPITNLATDENPAA